MHGENIDLFAGVNEEANRVRRALHILTEHPDAPVDLLTEIYQVTEKVRTWEWVPISSHRMFYDDGYLLKHPNIPSEFFNSVLPVSEECCHQGASHTDCVEEMESIVYYNMAQNPNLPADVAHRITDIIKEHLYSEDSSFLYRKNTTLNILLSQPSARVEDIREIIEGRRNHPFRFGRFCEYGSYPNLPDDERERILSEGTSAEREALASNPTLTDEETLIKLARQDRIEVLEGLARNPNTPASLLASMTRHSPNMASGSRVQEYALKNPSTPVNALEAAYRKAKRSKSYMAETYRQAVAMNPSASDEIAYAEFMEQSRVDFFTNRTLSPSIWDSIRENFNIDLVATRRYEGEGEI